MSLKNFLLKEAEKVRRYQPLLQKYYERGAIDVIYNRGVASSFAYVLEEPKSLYRVHHHFTAYEATKSFTVEYFAEDLDLPTDFLLYKGELLLAGSNHIGTYIVPCYLSGISNIMNQDKFIPLLSSGK